MLHSFSHSAALIALVAFAALGLYVGKALWVTMRTLAEQTNDPGPATPVLLTAGAVSTIAALGYLVYLTQTAGAA